MRLCLISLLALLPAAGCVSATKFKAQQAETEKNSERAGSLEKELASAKKEFAESLAAADKTAEELTGRLTQAEANIVAASTQLESVQKSNKDLQFSLQATQGELSKKAAALITEKDVLAQRLRDLSKEKETLRQATGAEIADLTRRYDDAMKEKNAVELAKEEELAKVKKNYEDLNAGLKAEISAGEIKITELKGKLTVNMVDRILFDSGKAEVKEAGKKVLKRIGEILANVEGKDIRIDGHTDNVPIGGELKNRYPTNWELSTARATAVLRFLQDKAGVDPKRLVAAGFGEYRPVSPNDTPENRALNRRIEIILAPRE